MQVAQDPEVALRRLAASRRPVADILSGHPVCSWTISRVTPGCRLDTVSSLVIGSGSITHRSVITNAGPSVCTPARARLSPPVPWPSVVMKSSLSTKVRRDCGITMKMRPQCAATSGAPPLPGRRTAGRW